MRLITIMTSAHFENVNLKLVFTVHPQGFTEEEAVEDGRVKIVGGLYDFLVISKKFLQGTVLNTRAFAFVFASRRASTASLKGSQSWCV